MNQQTNRSWLKIVITFIASALVLVFSMIVFMLFSFSDSPSHQLVLGDWIRASILSIIFGLFFGVLGALIVYVATRSFRQSAIVIAWTVSISMLFPLISIIF